MTRQMANRLVCWTIFASLAVAIGMVGQPVLGQDAKTPVRKAISKKVKANRHLPSYYAKVVTDEQREKINKIQEEYQPKVEALQKQLDELKKEQEEKISAVLTAEQKKQVEEAAAAAKAAKAAKKTAKAAAGKPAAAVTPPEAQKPAEPKAGEKAEK